MNNDDPVEYRLIQYIKDKYFIGHGGWSADLKKEKLFYLGGIDNMDIWSVMDKPYKEKLKVCNDVEEEFSGLIKVKMIDSKGCIIIANICIVGDKRMLDLLLRLKGR